MKYKLKAYSIYEFGQRKDKFGNPHQEDYIFPTSENLNNDARTFVLCDGMGGHDAGEVASSTVCETMGKYIDSCSSFSEDILHKAIEKAYTELDNKDTGAEKKMGTTMTFLKLYDEGYMIAHIGDSRVYHIRPGKTADDTEIIFKTRDHSLVNDLIKLGEITEEEAKTSQQKNVITRAMQPHQEYRSKADIHKSCDIKAGDYFYMCTDGMLENMEDNQLCYYFSDEAGTDEDRVKKLINATQENRDNHTAFIVHVTEVSDQTIDEMEGRISEPIYPYVEVPKEMKRRSGLKIFLWSFLSAIILATAAFGVYRYIKTSKKSTPQTVQTSKTPIKTNK